MSVGIYSTRIGEQPEGKCKANVIPRPPWDMDALVIGRIWVNLELMRGDWIYLLCYFLKLLFLKIHYVHVVP